MHATFHVLVVLEQFSASKIKFESQDKQCFNISNCNNLTMNMLQLLLIYLKCVLFILIFHILS